MANKNLSKAFRTMKVSSKDFPKEMREEIDAKFLELTAAKTDATSAERAAGIAVNKANMARAQAQMKELELLQMASDANEHIAADRVWTSFRDKDGFVVFEGLTERLFRNNVRAQQQLLGKALSENSEEESIEGLYEEEEDEGEAPPGTAHA